MSHKQEMSLLRELANAADGKERELLHLETIENEGRSISHRDYERYAFAGVRLAEALDNLTSFYAKRGAR